METGSASEIRGCLAAGFGDGGGAQAKGHGSHQRQRTYSPPRVSGGSGGLLTP